MMKSKSAKYIFIFCAFTFFKVKAQNIILNSSFDYSSDCNNTTGSVKYCTPWYNSSGSSDAFNSCCTYSPISVPQNIFGYQNANSGDGYGGFYAEVSNISREYISQRFWKQLDFGKTYCVSFFVSLSDSTQYAVDCIGAYFSKDSIFGSGGLELPFIPQIINTSGVYLGDKQNWMLVNGRFIANGGEHFITIGNFNSYANTNRIKVDNSWQHSYYYIDDVSLYQLIEAEAGEDKTICNGESATLGDAALPNTGYSWQPSTGLSNAAEAMPIANPTQTTTYTLTINYTGPNCTGKLSDTVTVRVNPCPNVYIANVFSPNNDGSNDVLKIEGNAIATLYFAVYNRWGNLVFETHSQNQTWDGTKKGTPCEAGVYVYYLQGKYTDGNAIEQKGNITLMR